jgi:hypothetical protein
MKFQLNLENDSDNSNTEDSYIEVEEYNDKVWFTLQDPEREVSVSKSDLLKVMKVLD